jgi:hypothetical protein
MSKPEESGESIALGCLLTLLLIPVTVSWKGFVIKLLWTWFLVPFGLPQIGIAWAIGLSSVASLFVGIINRGNGQNRSTLQGAIEGFGVALVFPAIALLVGWIASYWM